MARGTCSLATLLVLMTACDIFAGLIPRFVRPDRKVLVATWGGLVALQLLGAAHIRTASVSENAQRTRRQAMARVALQITIAAGLVPCLMLPLTLAAQVAGPGAIIETLELVAFPIIHLMIGIAIVAGAFDDVEKGTPPPAFFGWLFIIIPGAFILFGLTMAICVAIAGRRLSQTRSYMFCLVIAGIECMFMPVGTVLGVFTIIVLMRPTVRELFGVAEP